MRPLFIILISGFLGFCVGQANAACTLGTPPTPCTTGDGKPGTFVCLGMTTKCIATTPPDTTTVQHGLATPKYLVTTVIYAPPGTSARSGTSTVTYGSGSSLSTKLCADHTFKQGYGVSSSVGGTISYPPYVDINMGGDWSVGYTSSSTNSNCEQLVSSETTQSGSSGPPENGIDHDYDTIYLWLNPVLNLSLTTVTDTASQTVKSNAINWAFSPGQTINLFYLYVGWLRDSSTIPQQYLAVLKHYGISIQDFPDILAYAPGSTATGVPDPARYKDLQTTIPYLAPLTQDAAPNFIDINMKGELTTTEVASSQQDYKVGLSTSSGATLYESLKMTFKVEGAWTWTYASSQTSSSSSSATAELKVFGPAYGYTGPARLHIYLDKLFNTFLFDPVDNGQLAFSGKLRLAEPAFKKVTLIAGDLRETAITDAQGNFAFYGHVAGPFTLEVDNARQGFQEIPSNRIIDLNVLRRVEH